LTVTVSQVEWSENVCGDGVCGEMVCDGISGSLFETVITIIGGTGSAAEFEAAVIENKAAHVWITVIDAR